MTLLHLDNFLKVIKMAGKELPRSNVFKRVICETTKGYFCLRYITFPDLCNFTLTLCAVATLVYTFLKK